jgi:DNA-binding LytR/AlgR family response regulator
VKIAICDDDEEFRAIISNYIKPYKASKPEITESEFVCGEDLINAYSKGQQFDILFLDIRMKDVDGVEAAKKIREKDQNVIIIFITSYTSFVSDTFRVGAFQFLTKPVKEEDFKKDFERALELYRISHFKYLVKWKDKTSILEISEIYYIEASNRHLFVNTGSSRCECVGKISEEEKKLSSYNFVKCHQSYLVNVRYIKLIDLTKIHLSNGKEIPLSKHLRASVKGIFNSYILGSIV